MQQLQATKSVSLEPASYSAGATATLRIDTLGFESVSIDAQLGSVSNASNVPTAIYLQESDDTNSSNYATITGGSLTAGITSLPTTGVTIGRWDVNCTGRKRYIVVNIAAQATEVLAINARLGRPLAAPTTATLIGARTWTIL